MDYLIHQLFTEEESNQLLEKILIDDSSWMDGKKTAGEQASKVKNNLQLDRKSKTSIDCGSAIRKKLISDPLIKSFSLPKEIHGIMFSRSGHGQGYGIHLDNPYMSSGRSDLSFTLFLSSSDSYQGGELCIQTMQEAKKFKLNAGEIIIYPSTQLHFVDKVREGERVVCVGWIQSYVASNEDRNILFGLDAGAKGLLAKTGRSDELDLVFQAYSNLLRRLGD